ncbi:MAG: MbnH family di-heme enzyme [Gemmatimonadota bacterium]
MSHSRLPGAGRCRGAVIALAVAACATENHVLDPLSGDPAAFRWELPDGFPAPTVPADNPMSAAKVELGRRLFYDTRLSGNGAFSCASCHRIADGFADAKNVPVGSTGQAHTRNSMALANVAYQQLFGWAGPDTRSLEQQALIPMFGDVPVELGLAGFEVEFLERLRREPLYGDLFARSFPGAADPVTVLNVTRAIAAFERTFIAGDTQWDRARRGQGAALSPAARRGEQLFMSPRLGCASCHPPPMFSLAFPRATGQTSPPLEQLGEFINTGLYNLGPNGEYPPGNRGLHETTRRPADMGRMKVPSLRNVALTFPYMHDGSVGSLDDVVDHYARGGRLIAQGARAGDGRLNPFKDRRIIGFPITAQEKADLIAFMRSLTDSSFIVRSRLSNPWR